MQHHLREFNFVFPNREVGAQTYTNVSNQLISRVTIADVRSWDIGTQLIADSIRTFVDVYQNRFLLHLFFYFISYFFFIFLFY